MRRLHLVLTALFLLCLKGPGCYAYSVPDSIKSVFAGRPLLAIEGVWQWTDGASIMISADSNHRLTVTLLESPDPAVETPVVIGHGAPTAKTGQYTLSLVNRVATGSRAIPSRENRFIATIDSSRRLILKNASSGLSLRLNIWQALPYLGRISLSKSRPGEPLHGAWRLYPRVPDELNPIIL